MFSQDAYDPAHDRVDKYGDFTICIRPPDPAGITGQNNFYMVRVFDKDMEIVVGPEQPFGMYDAEYPNRRLWGSNYYAAWSALASRKYRLKDGKKVICEFGGEMVIRELPYRSITKGDKL